MWRRIGSTTTKLHVLLNCVTLRALYTRGRSLLTQKSGGISLTSSTGSRYSDKFTSWTIGESWFDSRHTPYSKTYRAALGPTHSHIHWQPGIKRPGREADHSNGAVKNDWSYTSIPPYAFVVYEWIFVSSRPEVAKPQENSQLRRWGWDFMQCSYFRNRFVHIGSGGAGQPVARESFVCLYQL